MTNNNEMQVLKELLENDWDWEEIGLLNMRRVTHYITVKNGCIVCFLFFNFYKDMYYMVSFFWGRKVGDEVFFVDVAI